MNSDDRRVRKTKKALREGLAAIMLEKELRSITVKELTDRADVHRATFYTHYQDIYDLYQKLEDAVVDEITEIISDQSIDSYEGLFKAIVDYVYDNPQTCRMFLDANGGRSFHNRISVFLEEKYISDWLQETGKKTISEEWRFFARYHIQGCLAIVGRWANNNYTYSKDKLIEIVYRASTNFDELDIEQY